MKTFATALKLLGACFYVPALLHLVLGLQGDVMLGARLGEAVVAEPSLSSQNRFYGVALVLYGVVMQLSARDLPRYEIFFKAAMVSCLVAGLSRLVPWLQFGSPSPWVVALFVTEVIPPLVMLGWYGAVKRRQTEPGTTSATRPG